MPNSKVSDLLYHLTATGVLVKDKTRRRRDDLVAVAHIDKQRTVVYLTANLTQQQKDSIAYWAANEDPEYGGDKIFNNRPET